MEVIKSYVVYKTYTPSGGGGIQSIQAGTNITVDNTDPANPIVSATGGGGGGSVNSVNTGNGVSVDNTDPANPIVNLGPLTDPAFLNVGSHTFRIGDGPNVDFEISSAAIVISTNKFSLRIPSDIDGGPALFTDLIGNQGGIQYASAYDLGTLSLAYKGYVDTKFSQSDGVLLPVSNPAYEAGKFVYNLENDSLEWMNSETDVRLQIGQEHWVRVYNNSGATIVNRTPVYVSGVNAGLPTIALAKADVEATMRAIGWTTHDIENNSIGYVTVQGMINSADTSGMTVGAPVYVSDSVAGGITSTQPSTLGSWRVRMGIVVSVDAVNGVILATQPTYVYVNFVRIAVNTLSNSVTTTLADLTDYTYPIRSGFRYKYKFVGIFNSPITTTGARFVLMGPTFSELNFELGITLTTLAKQFSSGFAYSYPGGASASAVATNNNNFQIEGTITPTADGALKIQFATEVAASQISVLAGGYIQFEIF